MPGHKIPLYNITTPPGGTSVVELDEAKAHLQVDFSDDDTIIQFFIDTAQDLIQDYTNQLFETQVQEGLFSNVEYSQFESLPYVTFKRFPVTDISKVEIHNGTAFITLTLTTDYLIEQREKQFPRVLFKEIANFSDENEAYPIRITATCGYANAAAVPNKIKMAIRMLAAEFYDNRGDCPEDSKGMFLLPKSLKRTIGSCIIREVYG